MADTTTSSYWYQIQKRAKEAQKKGYSKIPTGTQQVLDRISQTDPDAAKRIEESMRKSTGMDTTVSAPKEETKDTTDTKAIEPSSAKSQPMNEESRLDIAQSAKKELEDAFADQKGTEKTTTENNEEAYNPYNDPQFTETLNRYAEAIAGGYERQRQESDRAYEANKSAADRQALSRGMQRSSFNNQTLANIDTERAKARQQISDQEQEAVNQYAVQLANELRNQNNQDRAFNYQKERDTVADQQWEKQFGYQQTRDTRQDKQWQQQFQYQQGRDTVADEQWEKQFGYQQQSADQQLAVGYIQAIVQAGGTPTDDLLAQAGLSREDYNAMLRAGMGVSSGGGYGGRSSYTGGTTKPGTDNPNNPDSGNPDAGIEEEADQYGSNNPAKPKTTLTTKQEESYELMPKDKKKVGTMYRTVSTK